MGGKEKVTVPLMKAAPMGLDLLLLRGRAGEGPVQQCGGGAFQIWAAAAREQREV